MKKLISFALILSLVVALCPPGVLAEDSLPRVAILGLVPLGLDQATADSLADALGVALSGTGRYDVISRETASSTGLRGQDLVDPTKVSAAGASLGAQFAVSGQVARLGTAYLIEVRLIDVASGTVAMAVTDNASTDADLPACLTRLAAKLSGLQSQTPSVPQPTTATVTLKSGTMFPVQLLENISSRTAKQGQQVAIKAVQDVKVNDAIVIPKDSMGYAEVTEAVPAGGWGRSGKLQLEMKYIVGVNQTNVPIEANKQTAEKDKEVFGGGTVVGLVLLGPLWLLVPFFSKGKDISIDAGTQFFVAVKYDTEFSIPVH